MPGAKHPGLAAQVVYHGPKKGGKHWSSFYRSRPKKAEPEYDEGKADHTSWPMACISDRGGGSAPQMGTRSRSTTIQRSMPSCTSKVPPTQPRPLETRLALTATRTISAQRGIGRYFCCLLPAKAVERFASPRSTPRNRSGSNKQTKGIQGNLGLGQGLMDDDAVCLGPVPILLMGARRQ